MMHLLILAVHLLATIAKLVRPGGVRAVVAESLLLKHQLGHQLANSQILAKRIALPEKRAVTQFRRLLRRLSLVARCDRLRAHPTPQRVWTAIHAARNGSTKTAS
jgi:hypothetical protein